MKNKNVMSRLEPLIKKIEELDKVQRLSICIISIIVLGVGYYFAIASPMIGTIKENQDVYKSTQQKLTIAKDKAAKLPFLRKEREMKKAEFRKAMKALPEKREIPSLLTNISQIGQETGVLFSSFKPIKEKTLDFYGEIPVEISMTGDFHSTITFFDQVTSMDRIVNVRNIKMGADAKSGKLKTSCQAVTYKFVEQKKGGKGKKGKKRKKRK